MYELNSAHKAGHILVPIKNPTDLDLPSEYGISHLGKAWHESLTSNTNDALVKGKEHKASALKHTFPIHIS